MSIDLFLSKAKKRTEKTKGVSEADIENAFCNYAERKKCKPLKLILLNKKGFPDRLVLCPKGKVLFIEFKRKGSKQSGTQKSIQRLLESFDFTYHVCDEVGQAETILDTFINNM